MAEKCKQPILKGLPHFLHKFSLPCLQCITINQKNLALGLLTNESSKKGRKMRHCLFVFFFFFQQTFGIDRVTLHSYVVFILREIPQEGIHQQELETLIFNQ